MAQRRLGGSPRFFISLAGVVIALVVMAFVGLRGFSDVDRSDHQVFSDNFLTAEVTSRLATELGRAEVISLQLTGRPDPVVADRVQAELAETVIPAVRSDIARLALLHAGDRPAEKAQIARIPSLWEAYLQLAHRRLLGSGIRALAPGAAVSVDRALDPLIAFVSGRQPIEVAAAASAYHASVSTLHRSRTWLLLVALLAMIAAASMVRAGVTLGQLLRSQSRDRSYAESSSEYTSTLQATADEDEAHELLRRQLERTHPGSRAVVLARNNSEDRLEPRTTLTELEELRAVLEHAAPRSCLAARFATSHREGGDREPLTSCEVCGGLPGVSTCEPLMVSGEVIGSVLINHRGEPAPEAAQTIRQTVAQAAPVLGNLRNLAIAQLRAATDPLTGLPNQRAVQDTLKRMVAQATRTITPLAAVLVDLDHFKAINDIHGHDRGDEVLAAVGVAFRNVVRDSDFVGRYGGEEFLILLPSTETDGAVHVAHAARAAIAAIRITGLQEPITASAGVAVLPEDASDAVTLFRAADRALYAAKNAGRDRVHAEAYGPAELTIVSP